ncbi:unnamed protein product [Rotaria sp. Silwood2]|nr:unnamed protein product [Rotaria sp. Silwood2]CAF4142271.1 unnamed protein product [Rotaria sp. Silwood2]CAF4382166.1 unnamed protein product [Rotaria sp. Silwood2]
MLVGVGSVVFSCRQRRIFRFKLWLFGDIKCCGEKWLSLSLWHDKFQISNFYRHFQGSRNGYVSHTMKEMINNHQLTSSLSANNQQSFTTSENVPQQASSPKIIVPTILILVVIS